MQTKEFHGLQERYTVAKSRKLGVKSRDFSPWKIGFPVTMSVRCYLQQLPMHTDGNGTNCYWHT